MTRLCRIGLMLVLIRAGTAYGESPWLVDVPAGQVFSEGSDAHLTVSATGTLPITYLWRRNLEPTNFHTATLFSSNCVLVLTNIRPSEACLIGVSVTNEVGWGPEKQIRVAVISPTIGSNQHVLDIHATPDSRWYVEKAANLSDPDWLAFTNFAAPATSSTAFRIVDPAQGEPSTFYKVGPPVFNGWRTPPRGFLSWYSYGFDFWESNLTDIVYAFKTNGLLAAGYDTIVIDEGWSWRTNGHYTNNPVKFPSGIPAIVDFVHTNGFKIGFHTVWGTNTVFKFAGTAGHLVEDYSAMVKWGVDYLKIDWGPWPVDFTNLSQRKQFRAITELIASTVRASGSNVFIGYGIYPEREPWHYAFNSVRGGFGDIEPKFHALLGQFDAAIKYSHYSRPGFYNDPDPIVMSYFVHSRLRAMLSAYAIIPGPFLLSMGPYGLTAKNQLLTNREVLEIQSDAACIGGQFVKSNAQLQVWQRPIGSGLNERAVCVLNRTTNVDSSIQIDLGDLGLSGPTTVRDALAQTVIAFTTSNLVVDVTAVGEGAETGYTDGARLLRFIPGIHGDLVPGTNWLSDLHWLFPSTNNIYSFQPRRTDDIEITRDRVSHSGLPLTMRTNVYPKGLSLSAFSSLAFFLGGKADSFNAKMGIDDWLHFHSGRVRFLFYGDGELLHDSGPLTQTSPVHSVELDVQDITVFRVVVENVGSPNNQGADLAGYFYVNP